MTSEAADSNGTDNFDTNGECVGSKGEASSKVKQEFRACSELSKTINL